MFTGVISTFFFVLDEGNTIQYKIDIHNDRLLYLQCQDSKLYLYHVHPLKQDLCRISEAIVKKITKFETKTI